MKKNSARAVVDTKAPAGRSPVVRELRPPHGYGRQPGRGFALWLIVAALAALFISACQGFEPQTPAGFAAYEDTLSGNDFRAITANGVRYRVRQVPNEPEGDASLWTEAVRRNLIKKGYHVTEVRTLHTEDGHEIREIRTTANMAGKDYVYITAFCLNGKKVVLIEAGGAAEAVQSRDKDIESAMRSLKIR